MGTTIDLTCLATPPLLFDEVRKMGIAIVDNPLTLLAFLQKLHHR
jgi:hypothetical protein